MNVLKHYYDSFTASVLIIDNSLFIGINRFTLSYSRYGKFAVLDLLDIEDMWPVVQHKFDVVQKDLLSNLMSKQLLKEEK